MLRQVDKWLDGKLLADTAGTTFVYQECVENMAAMRDNIIEHWKARCAGSSDKGRHALFLAMAPPGSGKSRFLDEAQGLITKSLADIGNVVAADVALQEKIAGAAVFKLTFENGTTSDSFTDPEYALSARMLNQLLPAKGFANICDLVARHRITVQDVLEQVVRTHGGTLGDLTVLLLVDGLQQMTNGGDFNDRNSKFGRVVTLCAQIGNQSGRHEMPFVIPMCATIVLSPRVAELWKTTQRRITIAFPPLDHLQIFVDSSNGPFVEIVLADMGGHPRALEQVFIAFQERGFARLISPGRIEIGPLPSSFSLTSFMDGVRDMLQALYRTADILDWELLFLALLTGYPFSNEYVPLDAIGLLGKTLNQFLETGFLSLKDGRLHCPFIWIRLLTFKHCILDDLLKSVYTTTENYYKRLPTDQSERWRDFERFTALFWCIKTSLYFSDDRQPRKWTELHNGALMASQRSLDALDIQCTPLSIIEASKQYPTKSSEWHNGDELQHEQGTVKWSPRVRFHVLSVANNPGGDSFCQVQCNGTAVNFVMSNKCVSGSRSLEQFMEEYNKACDARRDFFIEYTTADCSAIGHEDLPPRTGLVHGDSFDKYFGPFASRAWRLAASVPINSAPREQLESVDKIGPATAEKIMTLRPFTTPDDASVRLRVARSVLEKFDYRVW
jgi:hypothetical protein